jgi:hypothetical protein
MTDTLTGQQAMAGQQVQAGQQGTQVDLAQQKMSEVTIAAKTWHFGVFPNGQQAANFLNIPPPQVAGEAFAISLPSGQVGLFYFL